MKKTGERGPIQEMTQDLIPGGLYEEPEVRVLERKIQLAKDKMAKMYKQQYEKPEKLIYDMNMFESLVALKPIVKKLKNEVKEQVIGAKSVQELSTKISTEFFYEPKSKEGTADIPKAIPKNINDDSFVGKTKETLVKYGVLESQEEITEQKEIDKIKAELSELYVNPNESIAELTTISTPATEKEDHFALQSQRQLENILLLEDKKKNDEKNKFLSEPSSDSAEVKDAQSDDLKKQHKEKMSDKG